MSGGPQIPGFTYLQHLGSGGFADVYLYEQQWPQQRVAVKVVRPDVALTEREKSLFTAEANAMARLADHPYIVSVITAGVTEGRPYLVMRYCPPPDLGVRVRATPMGTADAIATGVKLASAVETAHRSGIVHRDIKPSNVLVTSYQEPALTDFGIAGHLHEVDADDEVRISYPWSPPELLEGRSNGSVASDVYSLGATIWNLLTGRSPFSVPQGDNSAQALTARILHTPAPPTHRRDVPPGLERLLAQCLAKDPAHRPRTALEVARSLQRIEAEAGFSRTAIAVEGDRPDPASYAGGTDGGDQTYVKPITVIPASGPRAAQVEASRGMTPTEVPPTPTSSRRAGVLWAVAAVVVAAGLTAWLVLGGGDPDEDSAATPSPTPSTPLSLAPPAPLEQPRVRAERTGAVVTFRWSAPGGEQVGDTWEWRRTDTGESERTTDTSLEVRAADRVCLQVTLVRGPTASPTTNRCVE
ncbi:serine/threonine-protein kinase [Nocardioides nanhaiensis]|uniref:non-specific serine/threonine protein kinase n=1 Tax=Nocardioides nanhaiensis TaxID=1476871 RepID=A0ABP8VX92_9ACTN